MDATTRRGGGPGFDRLIAPDGYGWWYVDALSDDGLDGLTVIGFVGSVFSPYYARARRLGPTPAENHVAINAILYGSRRRWAMTERGAGALARSADRFAVGASAMTWHAGELVIDLDEVTVPMPRRLRGRIRVTTDWTCATVHQLDPAGRHQWRPIAPAARVIVELTSPRAAWRGRAYVDSNWGDEPPEHALSAWTWARTAPPARPEIAYDVTTVAGESRSIAIAFDATGAMEICTPPAMRALPQTRWWRVDRAMRSHAPPRVLATWEDTPFYARSLVAADWGRGEFVAIHESLDLVRLRRPAVQLMLPFRMPRRG
jgi:carotenoid 1,2-hydratase